jgi:hypothetical protein
MHRHTGDDHLDQDQGRLLTCRVTSASLDGAGDALPPPSLVAAWVVPTAGLWRRQGGGEGEKGSRGGGWIAARVA